MGVNETESERGNSIEAISRMFMIILNSDKNTPRASHGQTKNKSEHTVSRR